MTRKDRLMLLGLAFGALLVGFYMFVLSPAKKAAADAQGQVDSARSQLEQAKQQAADGRAAQDAYRRDRATIVKIGRTVPETDDIPTLLTQLQALAKKEGVWFTSYGLGEGATGSSGTGPNGQASSSTTTPNGQSVGSSTSVIAPLYPPGSVQMSGGLGRTPIKLGLKGEYFNLERYLRSVQRFAILSAKNEKASGRLMVVDGFTYEASDRVAWIGGSIEKLKKTDKSIFLKAELAASVYFAPPIDTPAAGGASGGTAAPAASPDAGGSTSTGTAAIGGIK
ncbi:MAG: type II secretion system protein M [Solirubrobacteraceae bacterium]|nr:type II secretion system protein M [Solirubrobacteraceae bacterium]